MGLKLLQHCQAWLADRWQPIAIAGFTLGGLVVTALPSAAQGFGQLEISQDSVITISSPADNGAFYQLLIVEQIASSPACWAVEPGLEERVDPLLLQFNFTGICNRATDSNGYSIRVGGQDLGWRYSLRLLARGDENDDYLALVGVPVDRNMPDLPRLAIGQTQIIDNDYLAIQLNPGWRLTKRTYEGSTLGHYYLTTDDSLEDLMAPPDPVNPSELTRAARPPGRGGTGAAVRGTRGGAGV